MRGVEQIPWIYDAVMAFYERHLGLGRWRRRLIRHALGPREGGPPVPRRILEVGSGTGRNLPLYRDVAPDGAAEHRLVAIEPDPRVAWSARRRARQGGAVVLVASAHQLPFRDGAFDTVVSSLVFCSVPDVPRGLAEVRRVLTPAGRLCMMEHVRHHRPWLGRVQDLLQPFWTWCAGGCRPNRDTEAAVRAAGFHIDPASRRARGVMRLFVAGRAAPADG